MHITAILFEAYLKCPTKCYLRTQGESGTGNDYAEWLRNQNESYRNDAISRLKAGMGQQECAVRPPVTDNLKSAKWQMAVDFVVQAQNIESVMDAVERIPSEKSGKAAQFIPIRYIFRNKLTKDDKLLLAFDAFVLSEQLGRKVELGKIIHGDDHVTLKVKTASLINSVRKLTERMAALLIGNAPPDLILKRHCSECEFQARCRQKAIEKDDLSLLAGMSEKERKKFNSKGIFTVTQLSYTFRPRRRPKRQRDKREKHHHSLKALAIREKKIHIVGSPEFKIEGTPVYFDVEGLPDRDFYYLIGIRIGNGDSVIQHSLWADSAEDEKCIWTDFLAILNRIENPVLIHYGSYETIFLKRMCDRYGKPPKESTAADAIQSPLNILSTLFAQVYFPTFSNNLKETGACFGARWDGPVVSGLQSIAQRLNWEQSHAGETKDSLLAYNLADCEAMRVIVSELRRILSEEKAQTGIRFTDATERNLSENARRIGDALDAILRSAHADYDRHRIKIQGPEGTDTLVKRRIRSTRTAPIDARGMAMKKATVVRVPRKRSCPRHPRHPLTLLADDAEVTLIDMVFTKNGCRKKVIRLIGRKAFCPVCSRTILPVEVARHHGHIFGHGFQSWVVYQRIVLRLPYRAISACVQELLGESLNPASAAHFVGQLAGEHERTERLILKRLLRGPVLHADETKISISGEDQHAWVLTDGTNVVFHLSPTREASFLKYLLADFPGVFVSDSQTRVKN